MSEREPELGLGIVESVDRTRIGIKFPATGERRLYALGTPVLKRVKFQVGDTVTSRDGAKLEIESVDEIDGLLTYIGGGRSLREDAISDVTSVSSPSERLLAGQVDECEVFDLRYRTLQMQAGIRQSEIRGYLGGRIELIPHQYYILREVAQRQVPRVLLADEVGLGKTIEACLILQRLLAIGTAKRVLILVPETLTHQWFVELLRRFNLWFNIYDEARCSTAERADPNGNPFLGAQLVLASTVFLANDDRRREQAVSAGWDVVVVDEAHHLKWSPESSSPEYTLVEQLSRQAAGLLLLTATPTQLGLAGHFARLRLLDPDRYSDYDRFVEESESFGAVADIIDRIVDQKPLKPKDHSALKKIFHRDPEGLQRHLTAVTEGAPGAREALTRALLDQHGTGRVMFRNTRASMTGFPKRKRLPVRLENDNPTLTARIAREVEAEETGTEEGIRYSYKDDPRIAWLASFLREMRSAKILLICRSQRKVAAIESALKEIINVNVALFHEGLPLVQRDRNAAWFAEPEGAQLLICSEIGSEGRNFQFAHHLVLFDLPFNPGLIEQRIGRLDRIGQTETIRIHVPYLAGSAAEAVFQWYDKGLDSFEKPLYSGSEYEERFKSRLLQLALSYGDDPAAKTGLDQLIAETAGWRKEMTERMNRGRDRLLELNSFNAEVAREVIERIRQADADVSLRTFLADLLDHFGVRIKEHEEGDVFLDPSHAYVESFPSIPADGMLATYSRARAITREDIRFLSADHPLVGDAIDLFVDSPSGTSSFGVIASDEPNLLVEAVYVLEAVADSRWHVDQFLAPTPIRVLVDVRGNDLSDERTAASISAEVEDGVIQRFLDMPGFSIAVLKSMVEGATDRAQEHSRNLVQDAANFATKSLGAELQRLADLRKVNENIRLEEIELAEERLHRTTQAINAARLRLDSLRLIVEGNVDALTKG